MAVLRPLSIDNRGIPFLTDVPVVSFTEYLPPGLQANGLILDPWDPLKIFCTLYSEQANGTSTVS
jgi:hypothetical protein